MIRYLGYYVKKYWYLFVLAILIVLGAYLLHINDLTLIEFFEKYENKVSYEPEFFAEETIDKEYLNSLTVGTPYLGTHSRNYIPSSIEGTPEEKEYNKNLAKDPMFMYKKNIDWSSGSITIDQYNELTELVGYHLNKNNNSVATIVSIPSNDVLDEYSQEVLYYTEKDGTLNINIYVEEVDISTTVKKTYLYTYKLKYGMDGKIIIR